MNDDHISVLEAYRAMLLFLEHAYNMTQSSDLAGLLGGWQLTKDGSTMDPAAWNDWLQVLEEVRRPTL
ncbi:MAG: hypothetical protein HYX47_04010 [Burkholderiales bacterium]|nr:hypothetical protein [Burkholderiales bacterium]